MRIRCYILLSFLCQLMGCGTKEDLTDISVSEVKEYYANGKVKSVGFIDESKERVGRWKYFDEAGEIKATGEYERGLKKSVWKYYGPERTINWTVYIDSAMGIKVNVPSTFQAYPNFKETKVLAFFDTVQTDSFYVNYNVLKVTFDNPLTAEEQIKTVLNNNDFARVKKIDSGGIPGYVGHFIIDNGNISLFHSQFFLSQGKALYCLNYFNVTNDTSLFYEIAFSLRIEK